LLPREAEYQGKEMVWSSLLQGPFLVLAELGRSLVVLARHLGCFDPEARI